MPCWVRIGGSINLDAILQLAGYIAIGYGVYVVVSVIGVAIVAWAILSAFIKSK